MNWQSVLHEQKTRLSMPGLGSGMVIFDACGGVRFLTVELRKNRTLLGARGNSRTASTSQSAYKVQKLMGHSDVRTTEIYSHLTASELQGAVDKISALLN